MIYLIARSYVGPNAGRDPWVDYDHVDLTTTPGRTNSSHEERTAGWLGTTNDISVHAYGAYETVEAAREALDALLPDGYRVEPADGDEEGDVVLRVKPGAVELLSTAASRLWCGDALWQAVTADTTDDEIASLVDAAARACREDGVGALDTEILIQDGQQVRDDLRGEEDPQTTCRRALGALCDRPQLSVTRVAEDLLVCGRRTLSRWLAGDGPIADAVLDWLPRVELITVTPDELVLKVRRHRD